MEGKVKQELRTRDPKKAWERLLAVLLHDEDLTIDELNEEMRECGIDPQESVRRIFETARRISRESHTGGRVSPHVSEILSQLAVKYYDLEDRTEAKPELRRPQRGATNHRLATHPEPNIARGKVLSYHRNYKDESDGDRTIRERNEERLREKAEQIKRKKASRKK
jgi:hypothetical protein